MIVVTVIGGAAIVGTLAILPLVLPGAKAIVLLTLPIGPLAALLLIDLLTALLPIELRALELLRAEPVVLLRPLIDLLAPLLESRALLLWHNLMLSLPLARALLRRVRASAILPWGCGCLWGCGCCAQPLPPAKAVEVYKPGEINARAAAKPNLIAALSMRI